MKIIKFKEFKLISTALLDAHPDALAMHPEEDDRAALDESVKGVGILEPLTVIEGESGRYLVIDGVGRMSSGGDGERDLPCQVVECEFVRSFVGNKNIMGRKRSTGSRLLAYVMLNAESIREAIKIASGKRKPLMEGFSAEVAAEGDIRRAEWSSRAISARLKVSNKDLLLAVQLFFCNQDGVGPDGEELDQNGMAKLEKVFNAVLCASLPIRRWKAAFGGAVEGSQEGVAGKAATDYAGVLERSLTSVGNVWMHWPELKWQSQEQIERAGRGFARLIMDAPESMRLVAAGAIAREWPEAELKYLQGQIKRKLG